MRTRNNGMLIYYAKVEFICVDIQSMLSALVNSKITSIYNTIYHSTVPVSELKSSMRPNTHIHIHFTRNLYGR